MAGNTISLYVSTCMYDYTGIVGDTTMKVFPKDTKRFVDSLVHRGATFPLVIY